MTKHRKFAAELPAVPDAEPLVDFVGRAGFIIATPRTKKILDVLARAGVLKRHKRGKCWRYTPSNGG